MNRHLQEVTAIDLPRQRRQRILSVIGIAALTAVTLWASGFQRTRHESRASPATAQDSSTAVPGLPRTEAPSNNSPTQRPPQRKALPGLDSSLSVAPQRLYLVSTSPGRNARAGTARLGISRENPQTYVAGAVLVNGARLAEIYGDRVILERAGQRTTLYVSASIDARIEGKQDLAMVGGTGAAPTLQASIQAIDPIVEVVRAMPFYENDVLAGVQVFPGQHFSQFAKLGLQSKDLIIAIDGAPVFDATVAMERLRTLSTGGALSVTVRRGMETKDLSLDGTVLAEVAPPPPMLPQEAPLPRL